MKPIDGPSVGNKLEGLPVALLGVVEGVVLGSKLGEFELGAAVGLAVVIVEDMEGLNDGDRVDLTTGISEGVTGGVDGINDACGLAAGTVDGHTAGGHDGTMVGDN